MTPSKKVSNICILQYDGSFRSNPTMGALLFSLENLGYNITIVCKGTSLLSVSSEENGIKIVEESLLRGVLFSFLSRIFSTLMPINFLNHCWHVVPKRFLSRSVVIGIDRRGLIEGALLSKKFNSKFIFMSFEIMFQTETSVRYKSLERKITRKPDLTVVQDRVRWSLLAKENELTGKHTILPVAYKKKNTSKEFKIFGDNNSSRQKLIFVGSLSDWTMFREIAEALYNEKNVMLQFNSKNYSAIDNKTKELVKSSQNLSFSNKFYPDFESLDNYLEQFDIGIAFYKPIFKPSNFSFSPHNKYLGLNIQHVGLASGKFSSYLRAGLPVLVNYWSVEIDEINKYCECVFFCSDPKEIPDLVENIRSKKPKREAVIEAFNHFLSFETKGSELIEFLAD